MAGFNLLVVQKKTSDLCGTGPGQAHILKETDVYGVCSSDHSNYIEVGVWTLAMLRAIRSHKCGQAMTVTCNDSICFSSYK